MELYRNWVWKCDYVCQGTGPQEDMHTHTHTHTHTLIRPVDELGRQTSEWTQMGAVPAG